MKKNPIYLALLIILSICSALIYIKILWLGNVEPITASWLAHVNNDFLLAIFALLFYRHTIMKEPISFLALLVSIFLIFALIRIATQGPISDIMFGTTEKLFFVFQPLAILIGFIIAREIEKKYFIDEN